MELVVQNLLENALKYTNENGYIKITLFREAEQLNMQLENSGPQLSSQLLTWINSNTGEDSIKRPKQAGLGLALVKRILQLHNFGFEADIRNYTTNCFIINMDSYQFPAKKVR
jgi:K+-sensing histidine kinase KdpD